MNFFRVDFYQVRGYNIINAGNEGFKHMDFFFLKIGNLKAEFDPGILFVLVMTIEHDLNFGEVIKNKPGVFAFSGFVGGVDDLIIFLAVFVFGRENGVKSYTYTKSHIADFLLFRAVEIQRICEAAATPVMREGANLSEQSNNKRIGL